MKAKDIDINFLVAGMLKNRNCDIDIVSEVRNEIENLIEFNDLDDDEKEVYKNALSDLELCNDESAYELYSNLPFFEYREDEPIVEAFHKKKDFEDEKEEIENLAGEFLKVINELDCDFEIEFSRKSPSIYVKTNIPATKENLEEFAGIYNPIKFDAENVYEEDGTYDNEENIEIRLSDHDFGGFTKFEGYGDYVSYRHKCLNFVYRF